MKRRPRVFKFLCLPYERAGYDEHGEPQPAAPPTLSFSSRVLLFLGILTILFAATRVLLGK